MPTINESFTCEGTGRSPSSMIQTFVRSHLVRAFLFFRIALTRSATGPAPRPMPAKEWMVAKEEACQMEPEAGMRSSFRAIQLTSSNVAGCNTGRGSHGDGVGRRSVLASERGDDLS